MHPVAGRTRRLAFSDPGNRPILRAMLRGARERPARPRRQRGLALVVVLWAAILIALVAASVIRLSRDDLNLARNLTEATRAELAADSALWTSVYMIVNGGAEAWRVDGTVYAWRIGEAEVRVRVTDELGRIDVNTAPPELLAALFAAAGADEGDAIALAEAVDEHRLSLVTEPATGGQQPMAPGVAFSLAEGLLQVPGMPAELVERLGPAITVYTGEPRPRSASMPALVRAAMAGLDDSAAAGDESTGQTADTATQRRAGPAPVGEQDLGDSPAILDEAGDGQGARSGLVRIEAEAATEGGAYFAREAVVTLRGRGDRPYRLRLWRRGVRSLFPATAAAD